MNKNPDKSLLDAIVRQDMSEFVRILDSLSFSGKFDEAGRIYGESLWCWVRDIDSLRDMIKRLDYIKNPSGAPPKRKWKDLTASKIIAIFKELLLERYGEKMRDDCEDICHFILENKKKRDSLVHHFNDNVEKMDEDCKKESDEDVSFSQHIQHMLSVANRHRIKHSSRMMSIQALVLLDFVACKKQHNQLTPTDKS